MADNKIQQPIKLRVTAGTPARAADFNRLSEAVDALISQKQLFRGFVNDAEINALCTSSHFGVYYYLSSTPSPDTLIGSGLLTVGFGNDMSIISQTLLLGATPVFADDGVTITEFQNSPSVLFRTYKDGQWGHWTTNGIGREEFEAFRNNVNFHLQLLVPLKGDVERIKKNYCRLFEVVGEPAEVLDYGVESYQFHQFFPAPGTDRVSGTDFLQYGSLVYKVIGSANAELFVTKLIDEDRAYLIKLPFNAGSKFVGEWEEGLHVPYNAIVSMDKRMFLCKAASGTANPPILIYSTSDDEDLTYVDGGYVLTEEFNTDEYQLIFDAKCEKTEIVSLQLDKELVEVEYEGLRTDTTFRTKDDVEVVINAVATMNNVDVVPKVSNQRVAEGCSYIGTSRVLVTIPRGTIIHEDGVLYSCNLAYPSNGRYQVKTCSVKIRSKEITSHYLRALMMSKPDYEALSDKESNVLYMILDSGKITEVYFGIIPWQMGGGTPVAPSPQKMVWGAGKYGEATW